MIPLIDYVHLLFFIFFFFILQAENNLGPVTILINNAGSAVAGNFEDTSSEQFQVFIFKKNSFILLIFSLNASYKLLLI